MHKDLHIHRHFTTIGILKYLMVFSFYRHRESEDAQETIEIIGTSIHPVFDNLIGPNIIDTSFPMTDMAKESSYQILKNDGVI